jgi:hypothetical protein
LETILYAYQMSPGEDHLLWFADTVEECERAAVEQRQEMRRELIDGEVIGAMAIYRFVFRDLKPSELVRVLNEEKSIVEIAAVDRKLIAVVAE